MLVVTFWKQESRKIFLTAWKFFEHPWLQVLHELQRKIVVEDSPGLRWMQRFFYSALAFPKTSLSLKTSRSVTELLSFPPSVMDWMFEPYPPIWWAFGGHWHHCAFPSPHPPTLCVRTQWEDGLLKARKKLPPGLPASRTVRNNCLFFKSMLLLLLSRFSRVWLCATP